MKNPNGYGSVTRLTGNRRRPFMVRKTIGFNAKGYPIYEIIGYTATREEGNILLAEYNKDPWNISARSITLQELFNMWLEKKAPKLGKSNRACLASSYKQHCKSLADMPYASIRAHHMQDTIDTCPCSASTKGNIKALWGHLDKYALELDIISKSYSPLLTSPSPPETSRQPFTADEIEALWSAVSAPWVDTVLILIYTGWRISEFLALSPEDIDLSAGTMQGGTKTAAGKNRIVPIHHRIRPLVEARLAEGAPRLISRDGKPIPVNSYRALVWSPLMDTFGMQHTPHETRHTFETLLDRAGANRRCIDLIMGHKSVDVGNRVYNHKTLEELRAAIELLE